MTVPAFDTWRLRVLDSSGLVRGAAALIDPQTAITCAHVVIAATRQDGTAMPTADVPVEFATVAGGHPTKSRVADGGWFPPSSRGAGDVAILRLDAAAPANVQPARLRAWAGTSLQVRAYGYPRDADIGIYATGTCIGTGGPDSEWVQIDSHGPAGWPIEPGFSGGGVAIADEQGDVVGIVVAAHTRLERKVGWMVPVEVIASLWPPLRRYLESPAVPTTGPGANDRRSVALRLLPFFAAVPSLSDPQSRQLILTQLRSEIRTNAPRHGQTNFDIMGILQACLRFPSGLAELVEIVRQFETGSVEMGELDNALAQLPPGAVR